MVAAGQWKHAARFFESLARSEQVTDKVVKAWLKTAGQKGRGSEDDGRREMARILAECGVKNGLLLQIEELRWMRLDSSSSHDDDDVGLGGV